MTLATDMQSIQARAALYGLLAQAFHELEPAPIDPAVWAQLTRLLPQSYRVAIPQAPGDLAPEFRCVFGHNLSPDCSPYETQYGSVGLFQKTQNLADLAGFYQAFGLEPAEGNRRGDYLPVELEFMSLLYWKEALALENSEEENAKVCRMAQKRFLAEHLGRWLPAFQQAVTDKAPDSYLARLAAALSAFVQADVETQGADILAPRPGPTLPQESEEDCSGCLGGLDAQP